MYNIRFAEFNDFKRTKSLPVGFTETTESTTLPSNTYAWNTTYKALHVNDASTSLKGAISCYLSKGSIGDVIELEMEVMNVSGSTFKVAIDGNETGGLFILESVKSGEFETIGGRFVVTKDNELLSAELGVYTSDIGEYYIRNINIKVSKKDNLLSARPSIRHYTFLFTGGELAVQPYGPYTCTTVLNNTDIIVTHDVPFSNRVGMGGAAFGAFNRWSSDFDLRTSSEDNNSFVARIFDMSTGAVVDPTTLLNSERYFNCVHHGYDSGYSSPY